MAFDLNKARGHLGNFKFAELFIEELGWSRPARRQAVSFEVKEEKFSRVRSQNCPGSWYLRFLRRAERSQTLKPAPLFIKKCPPITTRMC